MSANSTAGSNGSDIGAHFASAVAALGVAAAWQQMSNRKRAVAEQSEALTQASLGNLLDDPQYPQTWDDYVGQDDAKDMLRAAVARARDRREPVRHVLISCGEPGVGKTALAVLLAREIGSRCFTISGTPNAEQVRRIIGGMQPGDVLFIDEIHRLVTGGKAKSEWLLHVLQDDALVGPMGVEKAHLGITVVGATTDVGKLPEPLIDRFGVRPVLTRYNADDAYSIAFCAAKTLFAPAPIPSMLDLTRFIHAADFNPRRIKQLLQQAVDCHYDPLGYDAGRVLERARMTDDGLDHTAQRLLVLLLQVGKMGESRLRNLLQEADLMYVQRRLSDKGLITFTSAGITLTEDGRVRARELQDEGVRV